MTKKTKERRNILATAIFLIFGLITISIGVTIVIFSIPLMLILIGFITGIIGFFVIVGGLILITHAFYKPIRCKKCGREIYPTIITDNVTCSSCKTLYTFRNGK